jgi:hypothetical protein
MAGLVSNELVLEIHEKGDAEDLANATRRLRTLIRDLPIESVKLVAGDKAPAGSKTGELAMIGALAVQLAPTVIGPLIDLLRTRVIQREGRAVTLTTRTGDRRVELKVEGAVSRRDVESFVRAASALKK